MTDLTITISSWLDGHMMLIDDVGVLFFLEKRSHRPVHCISGPMCSILFNALSNDTPQITTRDTHPNIFEMLFNNWDYFYDLACAYSDEQIHAFTMFERLGWRTTSPAPSPTPHSCPSTIPSSTPAPGDSHCLAETSAHPTTDT